MGSVKPDHGQERGSAPGGPANERDGAIHDDPRIIAIEVVGRVLAGAGPVLGGKRLVDHRIPGRHLDFGGEGLVETVLPRGCVVLPPAPAPPAVLLVVRQRAQVPFTEMPRRVAPPLQHFRQCDFLVPDVTRVGKRDPIPGRMAPSQRAASCRRAHRRSRIEPVEAKSGGAHGIEVGRLEEGMPVVASVAPSLVVGHAQDHVRRRGRFSRARGRHAPRKGNCGNGQRSMQELPAARSVSHPGSLFLQSRQLGWSLRRSAAYGRVVGRTSIDRRHPVRRAEAIEPALRSNEQTPAGNRRRRVHVLVQVVRLPAPSSRARPRARRLFRRRSPCRSCHPQPRARRRSRRSLAAAFPA